MGDNASVDFDLKKDLAKAGPSEEQLRKQQELTKQNEKIKGLNAKLAEARDLEKAGNYDQAITIMQEATTADPSKDLLWAYLGDAYRGGKKYPGGDRGLPEGAGHQSKQRCVPQRSGGRVCKVGPGRQSSGGIQFGRAG